MTKRGSILVAICWVVLASAAGVSRAQTAPVPQQKPRVAPTGARAGEESSAEARTTSPQRAVGDRARGESGVNSVRTIDAINIEGEIAVPQVLFITSRDNRRYRDGLGKNFRMGTLDVARSLTMPNRVCVAGSQSPKSPVSLKEE